MGTAFPFTPARFLLPAALTFGVRLLGFGAFVCFDPCTYAASVFFFESGFTTTPWFFHFCMR